MHMLSSAEFFSVVTIITHLWSKETESGDALGIQTWFLVAVHVCTPGWPLNHLPGLLFGVYLYLIVIAGVILECL